MPLLNGLHCPFINFLREVDLHVNFVLPLSVATKTRSDFAVTQAVHAVSPSRVVRASLAIVQARICNDLYISGNVFA